MKKTLPHNAAHVETGEGFETVRVGRVVEVDDSGRPFVDYAGNREGPSLARITTSARLKGLVTRNAVGREVLLVFENGDPRLPIIIDTVYSLLDEISAPLTSMTEAEKPEEVLVDGERVVFDGKKEIVLRCGEASITLTRAGKVLIRGSYVLSKSSGANKIKGASIALN